MIFKGFPLIPKDSVISLICSIPLKSKEILRKSSKTQEKSSFGELFRKFPRKEMFVRHPETFIRRFLWFLESRVGDHWISSTWRQLFQTTAVPRLESIAESADALVGPGGGLICVERQIIADLCFYASLLFDVLYVISGVLPAEMCLRILCYQQNLHPRQQKC